MAKQVIKRIEMFSPQGSLLELEGANNPIAGKKVAIYGESVVTGYPYVERDTYSFLNRAILEMGGTPMNYGVNNGIIRSFKSDGTAVSSGFNGRKFTDLTSDINYQNSMVDVAGQYDLFIFCYMGTNDYSADQTDFNTIPPIGDNGVNSFLGAHNFVIEKLKIEKPDAQIMLIGYMSEDCPAFVPSTGRMKPAINILKSLADYWGCPILELHKYTGLVVKPTYENFSSLISPSDKLHPVNGLKFNRLLKDICKDFFRTITLYS